MLEYNLELHMDLDSSVYDVYEPFEDLVCSKFARESNFQVVKRK